MRVEPDGSLLVTERIVFDYSGSFSGAYRDIPLRDGESIDQVSVGEAGTDYEPGGNTELGSYERPGTYGVTTVGNKVRVVWHYRADGGERTFRISYRLRGLAVAYDDVVDVNMKVWGDQWPAQLGGLTATVTLPRPAPLGQTYRVFGHPQWVNGIVSRAPQIATLRASDVPAHQYVELRALFPRSLLDSTAGTRVATGDGLARILAQEQVDARRYDSDRRNIEDAKRHIGRTLLYLLLLGVGPALTLVALVGIVYGRERKTGYDREYEQQPPDEIEPALVPPLLRQDKSAGSLQFTATLFDLIRRGRYTSKPVTTEKKLWGGLRHEQVADLLLKVGDTTVPLTRFEEPVAEVIDSALDADGERLSDLRSGIERNRTANAKRFTTFKQRVTTAIEEKRWFLKTGAGALAAALAVFVVLAVILLWIGIDGFRSVAPRWNDIVLIALGGCSIVNAAVLVVALTRVRLWRRRTKAGQVEAERWDAFRRYLTDFPRLDEAPPATLALWERFLVYAIAFGIAERVLQGAQLHMPQELHDQSTIYWISPTGDLGSGATALAIGDLSSGFGSALTPPSSSGSSGFGGGFSGGGGFGGGGGGGGAW